MGEGNSLARIVQAEGVKENAVEGWQLSFRLLEKLEERGSLARHAVRAARAAFHSHPWSRHAMWSSPRSRDLIEPVCVKLWHRCQRRDDILAWRCESCRQTSLVDGVVPRSARRGFGEPHLSVKFQRRLARPHASVLRSRGF